MKTNFFIAGMLILSCFFAVVACRNSNDSDGINDSRQSTIYTLFISASQDYAVNSIGELPDPEFVILKENDQTMYSEISKIADSPDRFFILDTWGSRKLVSFDHFGTPITSYGRRGNGPGEYVLPTDFDIDDTNVYLLDNPDKSLLVFSHDGTFIKQLEMPFFAAGVCKLDNGNFVFNVEVDAETGHQLCVTDSLLNPMVYMLPYPTDYVGGWVTSYPLRKTADGIAYYSSPADTIYHLDTTGNIIAKTALRFENGSIDDSAKLDYIKAMEQGLLNKGGMQLLDNPVVLPDGRGYGEIDVAQNRHILFLMLKATIAE